MQYTRREDRQSLGTRVSLIQPQHFREAQARSPMQG
jgi:hypothetical protein